MISGTVSITGVFFLLALKFLTQPMRYFSTVSEQKSAVIKHVADAIVSVGGRVHSLIMHATQSNCRARILDFIGVNPTDSKILTVAY